ncbi:hypothetical protein B835_284 [Enterococcus mundtii 3F]|nr:hypothetical protein [Enterococcus mundtii 3F]
MGIQFKSMLSFGMFTIALITLVVALLNEKRNSRHFNRGLAISF